MESRIERGRRAERLALRFLLERGFQLLNKNWRVGRLEIDLIMRSKGADGEEIIHIVEVRSLSIGACLKPYETVDYKKRRRLISAAGAYIALNSIESSVQFDLLSVTFDASQEGHIEYFAGAFEPEW
ncbi:MAG: YraN family protein [Bacteroidales bacterium]